MKLWTPCRGAHSCRWRSPWVRSSWPAITSRRWSGVRFPILAWFRGFPSHFGTTPGQCDPPFQSNASLKVSSKMCKCVPSVYVSLQLHTNKYTVKNINIIISILSFGVSIAHLWKHFPSHQRPSHCLDLRFVGVCFRPGPSPIIRAPGFMAIFLNCCRLIPEVCQKSRTALPHSARRPKAWLSWIPNQWPAGLAGHPCGLQGNVQLRTILRISTKWQGQFCINNNVDARPWEFW